jgi:hypothetical protein
LQHPSGSGLPTGWRAGSGRIAVRMERRRIVNTLRDLGQFSKSRFEIVPEPKKPP